MGNDPQILIRFYTDKEVVAEVLSTFVPRAGDNVHFTNNTYTVSFVEWDYSKAKQQVLIRVR